MIELDLEEEKQKNLGAILKVIGVGGAGGNAVNSMINSNQLENVEFIVANTDAQALTQSLAESKVQIGSKITKGLGAGSNPEVGKRAAEEDLDVILKEVSKADILFLTAGFGGGTGSGALPIIAKSAKDTGILTVAVVAMPFLFEGKRRLKQAEKAIESLKNNVDTLIIVPNQKLLEQSDPKISMLDAFAISDNILQQAVKGISDIITKAGHINVDFADVREIMKDMGRAIMGIGFAEGEDRAKQAALKAINSPLLEEISIDGAKGVLINITGNTDLGLHEINEAASLIHDMVSSDAEIILGSVIDQNLGDQIMVTVIATGFEEEKREEINSQVETNKIDEIKKTLKIDQKMMKNQEKLQLDENKKINVKIEPISEDANLRVNPGNLSDNNFDLKDLDTPTFLRKKAEQEAFKKVEDKELKTEKSKCIIEQARG